jgi:hypothetical protein
LETRLTTFPCEKIIVAKAKVKTRTNLAESTKEGYDSKRAVSVIIIITDSTYVCTKPIKKKISGCSNILQELHKFYKLSSIISKKKKKNKKKTRLCACQKSYRDKMYVGMHVSPIMLNVIQKKHVNNLQMSS